jgi:hypothetical protein
MLTEKAKMLPTKAPGMEARNSGLRLLLEKKEQPV